MVVILAGSHGLHEADAARLWGVAVAVVGVVRDG